MPRGVPGNVPPSGPALPRVTVGPVLAPPVLGHPPAAAQDPTISLGHQLGVDRRITGGIRITGGRSGMRVDPRVSAGSTPFQGDAATSGPSRERMDGPAALTFAQLRETNVARCARWHPGFPLDGLWNGADWSNATTGELGELAEAMLNAFTVLALTTAAAGRTGNVVKKLRRQETGGRGAVDPDYYVLLDKLADEIADTATYLDLLAHFYGIDMGWAIARKFNAVSEREGLPERLS